MSKVVVANRVPREYNAAVFQEILRLLEQQINPLTEGRIAARHGAMTAAPTTGEWVKGDYVDNSAPAVVSDSVADYVIVGWICTASGTPGTWKERRVLVEGITADLTTATPQLGTPVTTTSGTTVDFTGIPSWVKRVTVNFDGVSISGSADLRLQLGDSGGVETAGYVATSCVLINASSVSASSETAGFKVSSGNAANIFYGSVVFTLLQQSTNTWAGFGSLALQSGGTTVTTQGSKSLSATLDRVRVTTSNGTDTFDAGVINILYE